MAYANAIPPVSLAGVEVTIAPPDASALTITSAETTGAFAIPAGALWIKIRNAGIVQDGDAEVSATIAGASWSVGREEMWEAMYDTAAQEYKRLPAVAGDGNGARIFYTYAS